MVDFTDLYVRQRQYLNKIRELSFLTPHDRVELTKEYLLRCHVELSEVFAAAKLKKSNPEFTPAERDSILEELVDSFKFLLNILIVQGFTATDFEVMFYTKSDTVDRR